MTLANYTKFNQYKILIQTLPSITKETILKNEFLLEMDYKNNLEIYYAPFEYVNEHATVGRHCRNHSWFASNENVLFNCIRSKSNR